MCGELQAMGLPVTRRSRQRDLQDPWKILARLPCPDFLVLAGSLSGQVSWNHSPRALRIATMLLERSLPSTRSPRCQPSQSSLQPCTSISTRNRGCRSCLRRLGTPSASRRTFTIILSTLRFRRHGFLRRQTGGSSSLKGASRRRHLGGILAETGRTAIARLRSHRSTWKSLGCAPLAGTPHRPLRARGLISRCLPRDP